jgi:hypothetical protein
VDDAREALAERLRVQAMHCTSYGSPLYEELLLRAADDVVAGGPVWRLFQGRDAAPADSDPLALMGAVHRLALSGLAPGLAAQLPSIAIAAGEPPRPVDVDAAWQEFLAVVEGQREAVAALLDRPIQTNEVGRSAALLGGFLEVARRGLPLRLAEIGASAGLNLRWDRYRYENEGDGGSWAWGGPASPVRFASIFSDGARPPAEVRATVVERAGCDRAPVDPTTEDGRLTLMSFVWADQVERFTRLRGALEVARSVPAIVDRADAFEWLERRLPLIEPGTATLVFHSIVTLYFTPEERARLAAMLAEAGARATADAPMAWLRFEHPDTGDPVATGWSRIGQPEIRLTEWPGGEERLLAMAAAHGPPVRWLSG